MNFKAAMAYLFKDVKYVAAESYDGIVWLEKNVSIPTQEQFEAAYEALELAESVFRGVMPVPANYPHLIDVVEKVFMAIDAGAVDMAEEAYAAIQAVRAMNSAKKVAITEG